MYEALRKGMEVDELYGMTYINPYFIREMKELAEFEEDIIKYKWQNLPNEKLAKAKEWGFADRYLSKLFSVPEKDVRERRRRPRGDALQRR